MIVFGLHLHLCRDHYYWYQLQKFDRYSLFEFEVVNTVSLLTKLLQENEVVIRLDIQMKLPLGKDYFFVS